MLLSAVSVLVVAQSSSEIPERLMNNPVQYGACALIAGHLRQEYTHTHTQHTHTHTLRIYNSYCFSTVTAVTRTRLCYIINALHIFNFLLFHNFESSEEVVQ